MIANRATMVEALEMQLSVLEGAQEMGGGLANEDGDKNQACIVCWSLASECVCPWGVRLLWPVPFAAMLLQTMIRELAEGA